MITAKIAMFSLILLAAFIICFINNEKFLCPGGDATIECAYKHPSIISLDQFQHYAILDSGLDNINLDPCKDLTFATSVLGVGLGFYPSHAHYSEELTETIEKISKSSPECFSNAAAKLDKASKMKLHEILKALGRESDFN